MSDMKAWQRGIELLELQRLTQPFRDHDAGLIHGAFGAVRENRVAEWLEKRQLVEPAPGVAAACRRLSRDQAVKDFRGVVTATLPAGTILVERLGYVEGAEQQAVEFLEGLRGDPLAPLAVWLWQEHPVDQLVAEAMRLRLLAVKISAASEVRGLWGISQLEPSPLPCREKLGLCQLSIPPLEVEPLARACRARIGEWAQHYSSYNARGSWTALALRGFGGDPRMVEKPAEMSKRWKADHPGLLGLGCSDTPLRGILPEAEPLIDAIPGPKERVRLMRLDPGGELTRHADIVDPDAGPREGQELRLHIPIATDPSARFQSWGPSGRCDEEHMGAGQVWYLDTRKPHACQNPSAVERIHLVVDTWVTPELLALLPC